MPAHTHPLALVPYSAQEEKTAPGSLHLHPDALKTGQRQAGSGQETEQEKRTMHGLHWAGSPEKWVPTLAPGASWPLSPRDKDQTVTWEPRAGPGDPAGSQLRRAPHPHCQAALRWAAASSDWCQGADKGMLGAWVSRATCRPGARPGFRSRSGPHQLWPDTPTPGLGTSSTSDASERTERAHG